MEVFNMKYTLDTPYPSIKELDTNIEYSQIILSNLGGLHSEMNAVSLYFYNHIILENQWPQLSKAMIQIAIVEMKHLDIFARMCYKLGADPRLWDCHHDLLEYWSPGFNVYPRQINTLLENAIIQEQNTITNYQYQISCIDEPIIQNMLNRIIMDEQLHIEIFESFLKDYYNQKDNNFSKNSF